MALFDDSGRREFALAIYRACREGFGVSPGMAALTVAQAALESAWGTSRLATANNNLFGRKGTKAQFQTGLATKGTCIEIVNGERVRLDCYWRFFDDWADCLESQMEYLISKYPDVIGLNPVDAVIGLGSKFAGSANIPARNYRYYTADPAVYSRSVARILEQLDGLPEVAADCRDHSVALNVLQITESRSVMADLVVPTLDVKA